MIVNATEDIPGERPLAHDGSSAMPRWFAHVSTRIAILAGNYRTFVTALAIIVIWAVSGPVFGFSTTWQLVINTGTTIITFLMVFLIQRAQNKDSQSIQLKLNELVAAVRGVSNRLINV